LGAIRLFTAIGTVAVVLAVAHLVRRTIGAQIRDVDVRYRARKFVTLFSYLLAALAFLSVFSDRLNGLSVAFGVAGAGIALALQEVIASIAGWIAISVGGFYSTGDRVQVGGINSQNERGREHTRVRDPRALRSRRTLASESAVAWPTIDSARAVQSRSLTTAF
jgi:small-conductance mechanosensitive channel